MRYHLDKTFINFQICSNKLNIFKTTVQFYFSLCYLLILIVSIVLLFFENSLYLFRLCISRIVKRWYYTDNNCIASFADVSFQGYTWQKVCVCVNDFSQLIHLSDGHIYLHFSFSWWIRSSGKYEKAFIIPNWTSVSTYLQEGNTKYLINFLRDEFSKIRKNYFIWWFKCIYF